MSFAAWVLISVPHQIHRLSLCACNYTRLWICLVIIGGDPIQSIKALRSHICGFTFWEEDEFWNLDHGIRSLQPDTSFQIVVPGAPSVDLCMLNDSCTLTMRLQFSSSAHSCYRIVSSGAMPCHTGTHVPSSINDMNQQSRFIQLQLIHMSLVILCQ